MNWILRLLISALAVIAFAYILPGVRVDFILTALLVAFVLSLLNTFLKPVLILFTIPITVLTFGLFLLVINAALVLLTDKLIDDFEVRSFWWALLFSLLMSLVGSITQDRRRS